LCQRPLAPNVGRLLPPLPGVGGGRRVARKLLVQSAIVFFGTLIAAALVALGEPAAAEVQMAVQTPPSAETVVNLFVLDE
jgi:hypothetical protein